MVHASARRETSSQLGRESGPGQGFPTRRARPRSRSVAHMECAGPRRAILVSVAFLRPRSLCARAVVLDGRCSASSDARQTSSLRQLWTTLRSQLRAIESTQTANLANLKQANVLAGQLVNETATVEKVGANLRAAYDNIERGTAEERQCVLAAAQIDIDATARYRARSSSSRSCWR